MTRGLIAVVVGVVAPSASAVADVRSDSTSGVDAALSRNSYDANGAFSVEGARLLPLRDLSLKLSVGFGRAPIQVRVPGIGDDSKDRILDEILALDLAFGMTLSEHIAIGLDIAAYRTSPGRGYGDRGRYRSDDPADRSTGLIALRPLSNIDQSASPSDDAAYLGAGLAGPLDTRVALKLGIVQRPTLAIAAVGSVALPFGDDEMLLGDRGIVFEPTIAVDAKLAGSLRLLGNVGARLRKRTVLEGYDASDVTQSEADARVFLDVGSEAVVGAAALFAVTDSFTLGAESQVFVPLPDAATYGTCVRFSYERCSAIDDDDYVDGVERGDLAAVVTAGAMLRVSNDVTATLTLGGSPAGARGEALRVATGIVWAPQPMGATPGRVDRDGDGVSDSIDGCTDEAEDKDGFQDEDGCVDRDNDGDGLADADDRCATDPEDRDAFEDADGCPERDNDRDSIADAVDRCADEAEDVDGFEDADGCFDKDNDKDNVADVDDKCPDDAETLNGVDDADGCPDVRGVSGPEEAADRIDLKGAKIVFAPRNSAVLSAATKQLLAQVAAIVKARKLTIRVEVHVPLGTRSNAPAVIAAQKRKDKTLSQQRAKAIADALLAQGVPVQQVQAVGLGSDRPFGNLAPADLGNERVDFIKAQQQGGTP